MIPGTSLQDREYSRDFEQFNYRSVFHDPSVLDQNFKTEEQARLAMAKSYKGVDDYGLGITWTVVRRGSIIIEGASAIAYAEKNGEELYVCGADLGEEDWQIDFSEAWQYLENNPTRVYTTADPYYISEFIAVNPVTAEEICSGVNSDAKLYRARGLSEEAETWWYYLETGGRPEVLGPRNSDQRAADATRY